MGRIGRDLEFEFDFTGEPLVVKGSFTHSGGAFLCHDQHRRRTGAVYVTVNEYGPQSSLPFQWHTGSG